MENSENDSSLIDFENEFSEELSEEINQMIDDNTQNLENDEVMENIETSINEEANNLHKEDDIDFSSPPPAIASQEVTYENDQPSSLVTLEDPELFPGFLASTRDPEKEEMSKQITTTSEAHSMKNLEMVQRKKSGAVSEHQFAFYQSIVRDGWIFERAIDRERVGFDRYAIDEAKIALSDIEQLVKVGMIHRKIVQHPTGPFVVYTTLDTIEKYVIKETIRQLCRKKRLKLIERKIEFSNWVEYGLAKKIWEFEFEISDPPVIGSIWVNNQVNLTADEVGNYQSFSNKREELKALLATAELKMEGEGTAVIVTYLKENAEAIKRLIKSTGWGEAEVLFFVNPKFKRKFSKVLDRHLKS